MESTKGNKNGSMVNFLYSYIQQILNLFGMGEGSKER